MPTLRPQTERERDALDNAAALTREFHAWQAYALRLRCEREDLRRTLTPTPRPMQPKPYHYHEARDRVVIVQALFHETVEEHAVAQAHPRVLTAVGLVHDAMSALASEVEAADPANARRAD